MLITFYFILNFVFNRTDFKIYGLELINLKTSKQYILKVKNFRISALTCSSFKRLPWYIGNAILKTLEGSD